MSIEMIVKRKALGTAGLSVLAALALGGPVRSQPIKTHYPEMAPAEQYRIANREDEIALLFHDPGGETP